MKKYIAFIISIIICNGCTGTKLKKNIQQQEVVLKSSLESNKARVQTVITDTDSELKRLERCKRELDLLQRVNFRVYNKNKLEFEKVMLGADIYSGVRSEVDSFTQGTVDSYYRYKADKVCADISNDLLTSLIQ
ncbi:hypothetical protein [Providencia alcalifaciens]|uniref:hypothetical protein n=1 Tax=Providencia alcalifaciens TaxID=126385 RepID=UPI00044C1188|nr:hypothetical protein [Providencia alcalifaciens]EUD08994.1 hypothetical protein HMPREF1564_1671 [Providencia alcalifaciens R90-1475]